MKKRIRICEAEFRRLLAAGDRLESQLAQVALERDRLRSQPCPYVAGDTTRYCTLTPFTLTDEEREAVRFCTTASLPETEKLGGVAGELCRMHAATLRGLLERLK